MWHDVGTLFPHGIINLYIKKETHSFEWVFCCLDYLSKVILIF